MAGREAGIRALRGLPVLLVVMAVLGTGVRAQESTPTEVPATATPTATPPARYWVGGSGAWDDAAHWSTTSGGPGGASIPDAGTDCVVDAASGVAPRIDAALLTHTDCATLDWTAALSPTFKGPSVSARVSGSLLLPDGLTTLPSSLFDPAISVVFELTGSGTVSGADDVHQTWTVRIDTAGSYTLPADWRVPQARWQVQAGTLDTGGHAVEWRNLIQDGGTVLLGASPVLIRDGIEVSGGTLGASAATVELEPGVAPVRLTLPAAAVHALRVRHGDLGEPDVILGSGGTVGTLTLEPGAIVQTSGSSTWNVGSLGCTGNAAAYIQLLGAGATFTMGSAPACDYVALENVVCAGATPCVAGPQAIDLGGNTNWQFPGGPLPTWTPTPTRTPTATASATPTAPAGCAYVTLNTARLATGEPEEWSTVAVGVGTAPEFQQCVRDLEYQTLGTATVLEPGMEPISVALNLLLRFDTAGLGVEWPGRVVAGAWLRLNVTGGWADDGSKSLTADWYDWGAACEASDHSNAALGGALSAAGACGAACRLSAIIDATGGEKPVVRNPGDRDFALDEAATHVNPGGTTALRLALGVQETTGFDAVVVSSSDNVLPGPRLVVLMCEPPPAPTATATTTAAPPPETPTGTLTATATGTATASRTPTPTHTATSPVTPSATAASTCPQFDLGAVLSASIAGSTVGGPNFLDSPTCGDGTHAAPDATYRLSAAATGTYTIRITAQYSAILSVRDSACTGAELTCVGSQSEVPEVSLDLNANQTAIIAVDGWGSEEGSFSLSISGPPTPSPTPGDCCTATETAGCDEARCSECVCALDVFCCAIRWDALCTVEAASGCMASCSCAFAATATPTPTGTLLPSPTATASPSLAPIAIDTPADNSFVNASPITVSGSAPGASSVTVNGIVADVVGDAFSATIPLVEGVNPITASESGGASDTIHVTLDTVAPAAPAPQLIAVGLLSGGPASVVGWAGSVETGGIVVVVNSRTGDTGTTIADGAGAFVASVTAQAGDALLVSVQDRAGNSSPSSAKQVGSIVLAVTDTFASASVAGGDLVMRGTLLPAPNGMVGLTMDGTSGVVEGDRFVVRRPVDLSRTTATLVIRDFTGVLAAVVVPIGTPAAPVEPAITLRPERPAGLAPLTTDFSYSAPIPVAHLALDADGDGTVDADETTLDGFSFTYTQAGLYLPRLTVTDRDANTYTVRAVVHAADAVVMDARLQPVWLGIKEALRAADVGTAARFVHAETRSRYQTVWNQLPPATLAAMDDVMTAVHLREVGPGGAVYEMRRETAGQTQVFPVWFQLDQDGLWRLLRY